MLPDWLLWSSFVVATILLIHLWILSNREEKRGKEKKDNDINRDEGMFLRRWFGNE